MNAVLFDLDGTLCRPDQPAEAIYEGAFEHAGVQPVGVPEDLWSALEGPPAVEDEHGYLAAGFRRVLDQHDDEGVDPDALAAGFLSVVDYGAVSFLDGAKAALAAARSNGPVGLVTNGPRRRQEPKLRTLDLESTFDVVIYAGDMDRRKPHPEPFERALEALDLQPTEALYVGNSLEYDVDGAHAAGLQAVWCPEEPGADPGERTPQHVLRSIGDLPALLEEC